jgi:hypothetical protein
VAAVPGVERGDVVSALCTKPERGRLRVISRRNHNNIDAAIGGILAGRSPGLRFL